MAKNNVKIDIIDKSGNISVLLSALEFQVPKPQLELLLNALRWERMLAKGMDAPPLNVDNIRKMRDATYVMVEEHMQEERIKREAEAHKSKAHSE